MDRFFLYSDKETTQGHRKIIRYIDDLVRNKGFRSDIKKLNQLYKHHQMKYGGGTYEKSTAEQKREMDKMLHELTAIINGYELLRKRCKRLLKDKYSLQKDQIAFKYGLDSDLIELSRNLLDKKNTDPDFIYHPMGDPKDMCELVDLCREQIAPLNRGEEIIYLDTNRQLRLAAYPIAICINQRASKRDVIDYIEKRWGWVEGMKEEYRAKTLVVKKRKQKQELVDFLWDNKFLPHKKLKEKLNNEFPKNGLAYYEIGKLISLERQRRNREI